MLIIGLTGSIGMGKSTAADRFRALGIGVFDADAAVHDLYAGPLTEEIEAAFPGTTADGQVDRTLLARALVMSPDRFRTLEDIVHPRVRAAERAFLVAEAARGAEMSVLEIPLLFESGSDKKVDVAIVVSSGDEIQRARVLARPGMSEAKFETLVSRQLADAEKRRRADFVVDTSGSVENCHAQIDAIVAKLRGRQGQAFDRDWRTA